MGGAAADKPLDLQRHVEAQIVAVVVVASEGFIIVVLNRACCSGQVQRNQLVLLTDGGVGGGGRGQLVLGRCGDYGSSNRITLLELCCCWCRRYRWLMCS